eukprot:1303816-Amphidinium_carterae.1
MGAGTPLPVTPPADLAPQPGSASGTQMAVDASAASVDNAGIPPVPAAAGAAAATEEEIQAVLAQVEAGTDWET